MKKELLFFIALTFISYQVQSQELWGMTTDGGIDDLGTIFKTDLDGSNHTVIHSFEQDFDGYDLFDQKLCEADNGKLYGTTSKGGEFSKGTIFEFDPITKIYTKKIEFDDNLVPGNAPWSGLIQAANGKLYGLTRNGGNNNGGTLFEYDIDLNILTKKNDFTLTTGSNLQGDLLQATNGKLYGTASGGGSGGAGVLFSYDIDTGVRSNLHNFYKTPDGRTPKGSLVQASNGKLYGVTGTGGASNLGALFEYDITNAVFTNKVDFGGATIGRGPAGPLEIGSNGLLYGITISGGTNGGVLYEFNPTTGVYTAKHHFDSNDGPNSGTLELASNNKLYGTMPSGFFEYDTGTDTYSQKIIFDSTIGEQALLSLQQITGGKLYGLSSRGLDDALAVIDISTNTYTTEHKFNSVYKGHNPQGNLLLANNEKLYGTTYGEGSPFSGTLFELDPITEEVTLKYNFASTHGKEPIGNLIQASDDLLYGMTKRGGANGGGVIFNFNTETGVYTKLQEFDVPAIYSGHKGRAPYGSLVQASNGDFYGMTYAGGSYDFGVLFEFKTSDNSLTRKVNFSSSNSAGCRPFGSLIEAADGYLYGMTYQCGKYGSGTMFKYNPGGGLVTVIVDFGGPSDSGKSTAAKGAAATDSDGKNPRGDLYEAENGKLYGLTVNGGDYGFGILFEFDPVSQVYTKKIDFDGVNNGKNPSKSLSGSVNGKMIGATDSGGLYDFGVLFEYDPITNVLTKKMDFDGANGKTPTGGVIDISSVLSDGKDFKPQFNFLLYPNPSKENVIVSINSSASYTLVSLLGQEMYKGTFNSGNNTLDISKLPKGLYLLNVKTGQSTTTKKIIKQ